MFSRISIKPLVATAVILTLAIVSPAEAQRRASAQVGSECVAGFADLYNAIEPVPFFNDEGEGLIFLWEEEKLARDVYIALADKWQLPIFLNIAGAEQNHMDMVWKLFETYNVAHSFSDFTAGAFINEDLGPLYDELVGQGNESLVEALRVGATIEDMDLDDLDELLKNTNNDHVKLVAYNLAKGSRNHLRAFGRALEAQDLTYTPQYLEQAEYDDILDSEWERGVLYDADGIEVATCGGGNAGSGQRRGLGGSGGQGDGSGSGECDGTGSGDGGNGSVDGECDGSGSDGGNGNGNGGGGN